MRDLFKYYHIEKDSTLDRNVFQHLKLVKTLTGEEAPYDIIIFLWSPLHLPETHIEIDMEIPPKCKKFEPLIIEYLINEYKDKLCSIKYAPLI